MTTSSDPTETAVIGGDSANEMTPRAAFIYGYYVAKIESLAASMQHFDMAEVVNIRGKILLSAADLWDSLHAGGGR